MIVITFDTTTDAMMMEDFAKAGDFGGRLIPIPNQISAGCGLAFEAEMTDINQIKKILEDKMVAFDKVYDLGEVK